MLGNMLRRLDIRTSRNTTNLRSRDWPIIIKWMCRVTYFTTSKYRTEGTAHDEKELCSIFFIWFWSKVKLRLRLVLSIIFGIAIGFTISFLEVLFVADFHKGFLNFVSACDNYSYRRRIVVNSQGLQVISV